MRKIHSKLTLLILLMFFNLFVAKPALSVGVPKTFHIACYYNDGNSSLSNTPLTDDAGETILYTGYYDAHQQTYSVLHKDFTKIWRQCTNQIEKLGKTFVKIMGFSANISKYSFGLLGGHYKVTSIKPTMEEAKEIFNEFEDFHIIEHDLSSTTDKDMADIINEINSNSSNNREDFISNIVFEDFQRNNLKLYYRYLKKDDIIYALNNDRSVINYYKNTVNNNLRDEKLFSLEPFEVLEERILAKNLPLTLLDLRKNIARAFLVCTQEYEQPGLKYLLGFFHDPLFVTVKPNERRSVSITIDNHQLIIINQMTYHITLNNQSLGTLNSTRTLTLDLLTGQFSKESQTITKQ